jgi:ankyrin repeat protein
MGAEVNATDKQGMTALMWACKTGRLDVVQALISKGAEVNAGERFGRTRLMWASEEGHLDVVQTLLAMGAEVNATDKLDRTALAHARDAHHRAAHAARFPPRRTCPPVDNGIRGGGLIGRPHRNKLDR